MCKKLLLFTFVLVLALSAFALPVAAEEVWDGSTSEYLTPVDPSQDYNAKTNPLAIRSGADLNYLQSRGNTYNIYDRKLQIKVGDEVKESEQNALLMAYKQTADIVLNDETFTLDPASGIVIVTDGTHTGYLGTGKPGLVYNVKTPSEYNVWYTANALNGILEKTTNYSGKLNISTSIGWGTGNGVNNVDFRGTYDGNNFKITGLYNNSALNGYDNSGLFGQVAYNGTVKNVNMIGACVLQGGNARRSGLIASYVGPNGTITNCLVDGIMVSATALTTANVGGLVGQHYSGKIQNCAFHGYVVTNQGVNGFVIGSCTSTANESVKNCYGIGLMLGTSTGTFAGGNNGNYTNCYTVNEAYPYVANRRPIANSNSMTNCYFNSVFTYNNNGRAVEKDLSELNADLLGDAFEDDTTGVNYGLPKLKGMAGIAVSAKNLRTLPSRTIYITSGRGVPEREFTASFDPTEYFGYIGSGEMEISCGDVAVVGEGSAAGTVLTKESDGSYTFKVTPTTRDDVKYIIPVTASDGTDTAKSQVVIDLKLNHVPEPKNPELEDITTTTGHAKNFFLSSIFADADSDTLSYQVATTEDGGETWSDFTNCTSYYSYPKQTEPKTELLKFRVFDGYEYSDTVIQKIIVTQNRAPVFAEGVAATEKAKVATGVSYAKSLANLFVDPDGDNLTYKYSIDDGSLQNGNVYTPITYMSYETGTHTIKIYANDGDMDSAPCTINLTITKYGYNDDVWNGAVDTTWYDPYVDEFTLTKPAQLAGLAAIVAGQIPSIPADDFEDRTITLGSDIVLNDATFTFEEESKTIKMVSGDSEMYFGMGLSGKSNGVNVTARMTVAYDTPEGNILSAAFNTGNLVHYPDMSLTRWLYPIGTNATKFKGTFDGNHHSVSGLFNIAAESALPQNYGLFGYNAGTVKNLNVDGFVYLHANSAAIVANNTGIVENCVNDTHIVQSTQGNGANIGGVVANSNGTGNRLTNLQNNAFIFGRGPIGGVAANVTATKASRLANYGSVNISGTFNGNTRNIGGIFGQINANTVASECVNHDDINTFGINQNGNFIGGIVGILQGGELKDSYNTGSFTCAGTGGGIVGSLRNGTKCHNCYNVGDVTLTTANYIRTAYGSAFGNITNINQATISDIYYLDTTYTTQPTVTSENVMARTAEEMRSEDFLTEIGEAFAADTEDVNDGYPVFADALLSDSKDILEFAIGESTGNISGRTIILEDFEVVAEGDTLTYAPELTVSPAATVSPASGEEVTFTQTENDPSIYIATYVVTAENGAKAKYIVALKTKANVASVKVDPAEVSVVVDYESVTLTYSILPVNANDQRVTWMSADKTVATVDDDGTVKGVAVGETTIIASSVDGDKTSICKVNVTPFVDVAGVTLPATASVMKAEQITLTPVIAPENASNKRVSWKSEDETIATVDEDGVVTGVKEGATDITATSVDGGYTATCKVTVESIPVEDVAVTQISKLGIGDSKPLIATVTPDNATVQDVVWTSDKPAVATVDENGVVTGKAAGEVVITATAVDNSEISASTTITVSATPYDVQWAGVFSAKNNDGNYGVKLPNDPKKTREAWEANVGNGTLVILGDYVYTYMGAQGMDGYNIGGTTGTFYKINKETGEVVDTLSGLPGRGSYYFSYATFGGGLIFIASGNGMIAVDPDAMEMLWSVNTGLGAYHSVQYVGGKVVCNGKVFDPLTGEIVKELPGKYDYANGVTVGSYYYVADYTGTIHAFSVSDWSEYDSVQFKTIGTSLQPGVAYANGRLYWGDAMSAAAYSITLDPLTGKFNENTLITKSTSFSTTCTPVIYGDRVYLAGQGGGGVIAVFDAKTMDEIYIAKGAESKIQSTPLLYHDDETDTTYVYGQSWGGSYIVMLADTPEATSGSLTKLITPSLSNYCFEQLACDKDGAIYATNDTGHLFKFIGSKADRPIFETDLSTDRVLVKKDAVATPLTVNATVTDGGTISYRWQQSADNITWSDIENATAASYTPSTEAEGLTYYRVIATNTTADGSVDAISQVTPFNVFDGADYITVSFRLIGCTKSEGDVDFADEPGDYKGAEYQNWVKTKEYTISNGSTAKELIQTAFADKNIKAVGVENNYIRAITGPEVLGGVTMEEFTNGQNSGWMYTVNGKHVDAINLVTLNDGDKVIMHYVNDYKYEDESTNPTSQYLDKWLEVPDVEPEEQLPAYTEAKKVIDAIDGIGEVTLDSEEAIIAAREAFDALSDEAKALVNNEDTLKAAEGKLAELKEAKAEADKEAAKAVADAIDALPATVTASNKEAVAAAKAAYDALTEDQKSLVPEEAKAKLDAAVAVITAADDKAAADAVEDAIEALPAADKLTAADKDAVDKAKAAYDALTDAQKALVPEETKKALDDAVAAVKKAVDDKTAADAVKEAIEALPATDKLTANDKAAVEKARADYDKLSDAQKALVGDEAKKKLADAEAKIKELDPKPRFVDVPDNAYFKEAVDWAVSHEPVITTGTDATHFTPNGDCTRGQVVTFLWRAAGTPEPTSTTNPFVDVPANQYYYKAVLWAVEKGVTTGTDKTHFTPNGKCTRGQVVTFLWRANGSPEVSANVSFSDVKTGAYYEKAVKWAVANKITEGTGAGKFSPDNTCTRAQVVTFLFRASSATP